MTSPIELEYYEVPPDDMTDESLRYISVKTQYAGMEVHRLVVNLFRHLNEKYFKSFSMSDESGFWETGDEQVMKKQFDVYNKLMDRFASVLENTAKLENESDEEYIIRVAQSVKSMENEE